MKIDKANFSFSNGIWTGVVPSPTPIKLLINGDANFFADPNNSKKLDALTNGVVNQVGDAMDFARASVYASDIAAAKGLTLNSIYLDRWDDIRVWFSLGDVEERMLGVRMVKTQPVDVYCDG